MKIFKEDIPFMQNQVYLIILSVLLTVASLLLIVKHGLNKGIDFNGGIKLQYRLNQTVDSGKIQEILLNNLHEKVTIQQLGNTSDNTFSIDLPTSEKGIEGVSQSITKSLDAVYGQGSATLIKEASVGPKAGHELTQNGQKAIIVAWILILIYLGYRFDFYFSPGAIIALIHDLIITIGAFAVTGREINLTVLAAFLTIIGYSVNDTIIVYDRIRENTHKFKSMPTEQLVNRSINETLSRTIVTSLVVFFVVLVLFLKGEGDIQDFAFAMIVGVIAGTYSSIFIASPVYIFLKKHGHHLGLGSKEDSSSNSVSLKSK